MKKAAPKPLRGTVPGRVKRGRETTLYVYPVDNTLLVTSVVAHANGTRTIVSEFPLSDVLAAANTSMTRTINAFHNRLLEHQP